MANKAKVDSKVYDNGVSEIKIKTNIGTFRATAKLHPDDEDSFSRFFGCDIALIRATIKYFKASKKKKRELLRCYETTLNTVPYMRENSALIDAIDELEGDIKLLKKSIGECENKIREAVAAREKDMQDLRAIAKRAKENS